LTLHKVKKMNKQILYITANAMLMASGILMIIIPSVIYDNYYALLSILVFSVSLIFPIMCNACSIGSGTHDSVFDGDAEETGRMLSWLLLGIFVTVGYSIPFELWRSHKMSAVGMGLTMGGGTVILTAVLIFSQVVKQHTRDMF